MKFTVIVMRPWYFMGTVEGFDTLQDLQYHPRFVELRDDKYEADTLDAVKAQFEAAIA